MAKVRVYELAKEFGVESKAVMAKLNEMGEFVRSASSTIEAPVVRRLKEAFGGPSAKSADGKKASAPKPGPRKPAPKPAAPKPEFTAEPKAEIKPEARPEIKAEAPAAPPRRRHSAGARGAQARRPAAGPAPAGAASGRAAAGARPGQSGQSGQPGQPRPARRVRPVPPTEAPSRVPVRVRPLVRVRVSRVSRVSKAPSRVRVPVVPAAPRALGRPGSVRWPSAAGQQPVLLDQHRDGLGQAGSASRSRWSPRTRCPRAAR